MNTAGKSPVAGGSEPPSQSNAGPEVPAAGEGDRPADTAFLESLDEHSDASILFSEEIDEELRRLALRKLFHLPAFNTVDGLDDYAGDYRRFTALGQTVTAEMRRRLRTALPERRSGRAGGDAQRVVTTPVAEIAAAQTSAQTSGQRARTAAADATPGDTHGQSADTDHRVRRNDDERDPST